MSQKNTPFLSVPRHSYNASVSSASSAVPNAPFPKHDRSQSFQRLSRSTTYTDYAISGSANDNASIPTYDQVPSVRPSVTQSDNLWTQIDVLDDVKNMADQIKAKDSFFNKKFTDELAELKKSQRDLLRAVEDNDPNKAFRPDAQKQFYSTNVAEKDSPDSDDEHRTREKLTTIFDGGAPEMRASATQKQDFEEISRYVERIRENLDNVGSSMNNFHETTRDSW